MNWKKKNNVRLDSLYGRNCIRVIPLVVLIKKIEYFKEEEELRTKLHAINEEDEYIESEESESNMSIPSKGVASNVISGNSEG